MRLRLTSVDEFQFLTCLKHGLWGSKTARFKAWQPGDYFAIIVGKAIAGLGRVVGAPYYDESKVWDNGVFPNRIRIEFTHAFLPQKRPLLLGTIRDALTAQWGTKYGLSILNQQPIEGDNAEAIVQAIGSTPNGLAGVKSSLDVLLVEAKAAGAAVPRKPPKPPKGPTEPGEVVEGEQETHGHSKAQSTLIQLGLGMGCTVWLAASDKSHIYDGKPLSEGCLDSLPNLGLSQEATKIIRMIDVIWLWKNSPICAFEVEMTTSVYSGLLRMSDLMAEVPAVKISLFVVAPKQRQKRVMRELARPTFVKTGLTDYCRYVALEDLEDLFTKASGFHKHLKPSVLDDISVSVASITEGGLE